MLASGSESPIVRPERNKIHWHWSPQLRRPWSTFRPQNNHLTNREPSQETRFLPLSNWSNELPNVPVLPGNKRKTMNDTWPHQKVKVEIKRKQFPHIVLTVGT